MHGAFEMLKRKTNVDMTFVVYPGAALALGWLSSAGLPLSEVLLASGVRRIHGEQDDADYCGTG
jgi:hypothetical protein